MLPIYIERKFQNALDIFKNKEHNILATLLMLSIRFYLNIEAWLRLVERCVRDAEAASSNLVASMRVLLYCL